MPLGEFELIARFFDRGPARDAILGVGDDCALLAPPEPHSVTAVSTDMLLVGRHFLADDDPVSVGHKALAVNLSDLAAMGARPRAFTLALALPQVDEGWLAGFCSGLFAIADRHGCELVGGDTTRGPLTICITVFGDVPPEAALRRDGAQPDDDLWVSGTLGAAALAVHAIGEGRPLAAGDPARLRLDRPEPRVALGLSLRYVARAAIDLSDGLLGDLGHVLDRSRVGAEVDWPAVPVDPALDGLPDALRLRLALAGGDDYELLFSAAPENRGAIEAIGRRLGLPLARIGRIVAGEGLRVRDARGRPLAVEGHGFDHFA
ncbi:MAG: thiamine-phosphate kinase [Burkholderiaceae bacterium]|nr:thiamine-phosphate kinase [Burkholderiaceae bacterium]